MPSVTDRIEELGEDVADLQAELTAGNELAEDNADRIKELSDQLAEAEAEIEELKAFNAKLVDVLAKKFDITFD